MTNRRALAPMWIVIPGFAALLSSAGSASAGAWDGVWTGKLDDMVSLSIRIVDDKAVSYKILGTPMGIKFSDISNGDVQFGDPDHYRMLLKRTGDGTATASYYGRHGYSITNLTRTRP